MEPQTGTENAGASFSSSPEMPETLRKKTPVSRPVPRREAPLTKLLSTVHLLSTDLPLTRQKRCCISKVARTAALEFQQGRCLPTWERRKRKINPRRRGLEVSIKPAVWTQSRQHSLRGLSKPRHFLMSDAEMVRPISPRQSAGDTAPSPRSCVCLGSRAPQELERRIPATCWERPDGFCCCLGLQP